jgi:ribosome-associated protein
MVKKSSSASEQLVNEIVKGIQEVKGHEILTVDLRNIPNSVSDFFVICHGTSDTQVEAIARSVEDSVEIELDEKPVHKEGTENANWILLDYFNVVVHIFKPETREYYNLEKLWADADVKEIEYQL